MTALQATWAAGGTMITIERFMAEALYHPVQGYYMRERPKFGSRGDFTTAPHLGETLAIAIARWLLQRRPPRSGPLEIIETGAGDGRLATQILDALGWWQRRRTSYRIVEISPFLRTRQQQTRYARTIRWYPDITLALADCARPVVVSNEFVDAFPCRQFEWRDGRWWEIALSFSSDGAILRSLIPFRPPVGPMPGIALLPAVASNWPRDGQRVEYHGAYADWFAAAFDNRRPVDLLTIDYGATFPGLYHRRPRGTLRAYYHHLRLEDEEVFERAGHQDLTADVNFSDLTSLASGYGFVPQLTSLADFLTTFSGSRPIPVPFTDSFGPGGAFQVLALARL